MEDGLTVARAVEIAQGMEAADRNAKELKSVGSGSGVNENVHLTRSSRKCSRCGRSGHDEKDCKFRDAVCHKCGKSGHIAPVCRGQASAHQRPVVPPLKPSSYQKGRRPGAHQSKWKSPSGSNKWTGSVQQPAEVSDNDNFSLFTVGDDLQSPLLVDVYLENQQVKMEVDTGATVSIISERTFHELFPEKSIQPSQVELKTYTGEILDIAGEATVQVSYQHQPPKQLPLVVVTGTGPTLLGRNWLQHIRLDWGSIKSILHHKLSLSTLLEKYEAVFTDRLGTITPFKAKMSVLPNAKPKFHRPRQVPYALKPAVEEELARLEEAGVLKKVDFSEWAAPIVTVPKQDGKVRVCGDYKVTVNPVLEVDQYPLPRPEDLFATLAGGKYFSTLDLSHAYNQLLLEEDSQIFLTINTHRGLYRYTRLPFGVASAPAVFQKCMDVVLQGIENVICYMDDILVTGKTESEHLKALQEVLQRFLTHGIHVKKSKCTFMKLSVQYLGHRIDADGLHATDSKIKAITNAPTPTSKHELRSFLGLINYYGRFISNLSSLLHPLNQLLCKDVPFKWSARCEQALKLAKEKIVSPNVLVHYNPELPIKLAGDASAYGIGAVISHVMPDNSERPIAFASRTLLPSEQKYSQVEKEALSLIFGVMKFHVYLYGRKFTLVTDHRPLLTILGPNKGIPPMVAARLQRWAIKLSAYTYNIEFRRTTEHSNADGLSRLPLSNVEIDNHFPSLSLLSIQQIETLPVTAAKLAQATSRDEVLSKALQYIVSGWPSSVDNSLLPYFNKANELSVEEGCILWGMRVVIPFKYRQDLLKELHEGHPGICKMKAVARSYLWWPGLDGNIEELASSCQECQKVKKSPQTAPLHPWVWPSRPYQRVHVDLAGPFQGAMFLVAVDAYSKWPDVFIMKTTTVDKVIDIFRHLFAVHGLPEQIVTDNGSQFTSEDFAIFLHRNGIKHIRSSPYHPATNGLAERFIQTMKLSLKASEGKGTLSHRLCDFLLKYRSSPHSTTGVSPSMLLFKREMRIRLDLLRPDMRSRVAERQMKQKADYNRNKTLRTFQLGQTVIVKNFRTGPNWIPAKIVEKLGPLSYLVETEDSQQLWRRHVDHIRSGGKQLESDKDWDFPTSHNRTEESSTVHPDDNQEMGGDSLSTQQSTSTQQSSIEQNQTVSEPRYPQRSRRSPGFYRPETYT